MRRKLPWMVRQGDVLIIAIAALPANLTARKRTSRGVVLAEGEVTGHAHAITAKHVVHYDAPNPQEMAKQLLKEAGLTFELHEGAAVSFVDVVGDVAELVHEEHGTIAMPTGPKIVIQQREWSDAEEPIQVRD